MKRLTVLFSGWVDCDPDATSFMSLNTLQEISGTEYCNLPEEKQGDYILVDLAQAYSSALDGELTDCHIEVEEEI